MIVTIIGVIVVIFIIVMARSGIAARVPGRRPRPPIPGLRNTEFFRPDGGDQDGQDGGGHHGGHHGGGGRSATTDRPGDRGGVPGARRRYGTVTSGWRTADCAAK